MANLGKISGLALLLVMILFLTADTLIIASIVPQLRAEFGVSDTMIGFLGSAFVLTGAVVGLYAGFMADRLSRKWLMVAAVGVGVALGIACGIYALTQHFYALLGLRILAGIGIGATYPITMSLLSDYFPPQHRAKANALAEITWLIGTLLGPVMGSFAVTTDYGWRLAFLIAALPNVVLLALFILLYREPPRDGSMVEDETAATTGDYRAGFRAIFQSKSNLFFFLQGIPGSLPWGLLPFWLISYFVTDRGFAQAEATAIWEGFAIVSLVGVLAWAGLGDAIHKANPKRAVYAVCAAAFTGIASFLILFHMNLPYHLAVVLIPLTALGIAAPSTNLRSWLMNSNPAGRRGAVFAVFFLSDSVGKASGPFIGGVLASSLGSMHMAINVAVGFWFLHVALMTLGARHYKPMEQTA